MLTRQEPHVHDYKKLGFITEFGTVARENQLVPDVVSRTIDRIILVRTCVCGASQAFDCGPKVEMREKYAELTKG